MIAYLISFALSGNTLEHAYNEILQAQCSFITPECFKEHKLCISETICNDYPISTSCMLSTGLTDEFVKKHGKDKKAVLQTIARTLSLLMDKNIFIIGWNVSGVILDALEINFMNNHVDFDMPKLRQYPNIIDVNRIVELTMPFETLNGSSYSFDSVLFQLKNEKQTLSPIDFQKQFADVSDPSKNCINFSRNMFFILQKMMKRRGFSKFSEVARWLNEPHLLSRLSFGKYKDKTFEYVFNTDVTYLHWLKKSKKDYISNAKDVEYTINSILNDSSK